MASQSARYGEFLVALQSSSCRHVQTVPDRDDSVVCALSVFPKSQGNSYRLAASFVANTCVLGYDLRVNHVDHKNSLNHVQHYG